MRRSSKKLPTDPNKRALEIVRLSTEESEDEQPKERSVISEYLSQIGRKGGLKGGKARAAKLSAKKRHDIARKAAKSRWSKKSQ
ncbi:MAG: hypothetical protein ABSB79_12805 [Syntrophales bacterium]|jgi:hypothetical protein